MSATSSGASRVCQWIEYVLNEVIQQAAKGRDGNVSVVLRRMSKYEAAAKTNGHPTEFSAKDHEVKYSWPGRNPDEAWRFACAVAVLNCIHSAICSGIPVTKRDIYYSDPDLFGEQSVVDSLIDDIAHTCQVPRQDLLVTASPKGLFATPTIADGQVQTIGRTPPSFDSIRWILVVEKEAVFNTLHENLITSRDGLGQGMIVTAKGYPDLATREFLRSCLDSRDCTAQLFGLFDFDVYGVDILKCYRVGSKASASTSRLNLPEMKWLGLMSADMAVLAANVPFMAMSAKDRKRASNLLETCSMREGMVVSELQDCRSELQRMLVLNRKAEVEVLEDRLCAWVERKIFSTARI